MIPMDYRLHFEPPVRRGLSGSAHVSRAGERVFAIADFPGSSSRRASTKLKKSSFRRDAETSTPEACAILLQLAEPAQRNGSLRIVDFVAAVERAYLYPLKSIAFD